MTPRPSGAESRRHRDAISSPVDAGGAGCATTSSARYSDWLIPGCSGQPGSRSTIQVRAHARHSGKNDRRDRPTRRDRGCCRDRNRGFHGCARARQPARCRPIPQHSRNRKTGFRKGQQCKWFSSLLPILRELSRYIKNVLRIYVKYVHRTTSSYRRFRPSAVPYRPCALARPGCRVAATQTRQPR